MCVLRDWHTVERALLDEVAAAKRERNEAHAALLSESVGSVTPSEEVKRRYDAAHEQHRKAVRNHNDFIQEWRKFSSPLSRE
jgi:hypothetical protein